MAKKTIGVVFGGRSGEHEVSLKSAQSVMKALEEMGGYAILPMGITKEGNWICGPSAMEQLIEKADASLLDGAASLDLSCLEFGSGKTIRTGRLPSSETMNAVDVVFPVLHGPYGEDGTVQGMFQLARIPFVGCGVMASSVGMDKTLFKAVMRAHGIPVTRDVSFRRSDWKKDQETIIQRIETGLKYPVFCKPVNMGSSVGISKCHNRDELMTGVALAAQYDRRILVEWSVPNAREIEVSVLGNDFPEASIPGEIVPRREFYDYTAKYIDDGDAASELLIPADLDETEARMIRETATRAFTAVDGTGMARVDFLINRSTGDIYMNEINTIPGFTDISMYSKLWDATGIPYGRLIERLIHLAEERFAEQEQNRVDYA